MKIQGESGLVNVELDGADGEDLVAVRQARAQQTALARAGVTSASGFETNQAAEVADAGAATIANTAAATVSASQLVNGTASLDAALEATPKAQYVTTPAEAGDLAAITSGKDGQVPLSRQQVVDTVLTAVSDPAQRAQVKALIDAGVTDDSLARAFTQVIDARQTPGDKKLSLDLVGFVTSEVPVQNGEYEYLQSVTNPASSPTHFDASMSVGADGSVNGKTLVADTLAADDLKPYPNGNSADHVKTQFDVVGDPGNLASLTAAHGDQPAISRQAVVDTVLQALPDDQRAQAAALIAKGVTDDSLARAFSQVIEARKTPGEKTPSIDLVGFKTVTEQVGWGESMEYRDVTTPADAPTHFTGKMSVGEDGSVNGKKLMADIAVAVTSATATVDNEFKDQTLKEAGLSDEWMQNASEAQKAYALAKIIEAKATPGTKTLDLSYPYSYTQMSGEDSQQVNTTAAGVLTLKVDEQGLVNGKPLTIEAALNATRTVEQMPNAVRRATLRSLGFDSEPIRNASADQTKYALVKASMATRTPGTTQFEVHMGGDKYAVGMKIGENGEILGAGTAKIPPPPKKSWWKSVVSVVCTVVSICYPPAAIICSGIQSAIAISSGAKGLGLIAAVAGAAAGIGDIAGFAGAADLANVASNLNTANAAVAAYTKGDYLGALSGALTATSGLTGTDFGLGGTLGQLTTVSRAVSGVSNALKNGDVLGLISAGAAGTNALGQLTGNTSLASADVRAIGQVAQTASNVANAVKTGDLAGLVSSGVAGANALGSLAGFSIGDEVKTIGQIAQTAGAVMNGNVVQGTTGVLNLAARFGPGLLGVSANSAVDSTAAAVDSVSGAFGDTSSTLASTGLGVVNSVYDLANATGNLFSGGFGSTLDALNLAGQVGGLANDFTSGLGLDSFSLGTFADGYPVSDGASGTAGTATAAPDEMDPDNFGAGTRDVDVNLVRPPTVAEFNKSLAEARSDARANPTSYATGPDGYPMVRLQGPDGAMRDYSLAMREDLAGKIPGGSTANYRDFVAANFNGLDSPAALAAYRTLLTPKPPATDSSSSGLLFDGPGVSLAGASFSDLSQPDRGGLTLSEAADIGKAVSKSAPPSSWDQLAAFAKQQGNAAMNTLNIANDALMSLIPGTQANKTVSNAMVSFMQDMGTVAGMVHEHPDQAAKLIENAVGKVWSTVVSPGEWGDAALSAAKTLLKPFGDLSDVLAKDPNSVAPGELAMAAFGAATVINPRSVVSGTVSAVRRELAGDLVEDLGRQVSTLSRDPALAQTVARALETHPSALENMGQVDLADRIAEALHGPLKGLTGDELVAGLQTVIDPSLQATVRAAGQLSATAQQAFPELAAKLKAAPAAVIERVGPQLDALLASEGMTPELAVAVKRSLNAAGSGLETAIGNAQRILASGHPELLQTLGTNRELAGINPEALSKYLAMSGGRDLSAIPDPIRAALKSGPQALDDVTNALRTDSQAAGVVAARDAAARTAQLRESLNLPSQFPFAGWNLDALGVFSRDGVSASLKADLARGTGTIWNEIKANPAAKNDPAAMQRLIDKVKPAYSGKP